MTFLEILYSLFLRPLVLLFDLVFSLVNRSVSNPGVSIFFLSLFVNILVLPLYRRADAMQSEQRDKEEKLKYWVSHIRKTFKGDERFMMLQTYYRQNNYKPYHILKSSISLLLEIPFFIAAYRYLSGLQLLRGVSFGPIPDLSLADGMLDIGGFTINILPILMTVINLISTSIYMRGHPFRNKIQTYGMALIFFVFLYNSPSGLVLYWTLNNVFSLIKNILYKVKNPKKVISVSLFILGLVLQEYVLLFQPFDAIRKTAFVAVFSLILQASFVFRNLKISWNISYFKELRTTDHFIFLFGCIFLAIMSGSLISSEVIKSSPLEFVNFQSYYSPLWFILNSFLLAAGTFVVWFSVYYRLSSNVGKKTLSLVVWVLTICSIINYLFFGNNHGNLSPSLVYTNSPLNTKFEYILNTIILIIISIGAYFLWLKREKIVNSIVLAFCVTGIVMTFINIMDINKSIDSYKTRMSRQTQSTPKITLSKNGKNIVVIMMDRSIGYYIPFLMAERPELQRQFDGFTFFPNTLTYATATVVALPELYGGYEYTPAASNAREDISLSQKHYEALRMMPVLFDDAGYKVSVLDPFDNYYGQELFDDHPNIQSSHVTGKFISPEMIHAEREIQKRNFFCFGIFRMAPLILAPSLYSMGLYNDSDAIAGVNPERLTEQVLNGLRNSIGFASGFVYQYEVLANLNNITETTNLEINTYNSLDNCSAHEPVLLQMPDYTVSSIVDNTEYDALPMLRTSSEGETIELEFQTRVKHYHANMASYLLLGKWMDYLRENGVYDNTRIIIAADHGYYQRYSNHILGDEFYEDILYFNPVLMIKDFNSKGFKTDETFMTNADVPVLTMSGLLQNPVNPATGNPITNEAKEQDTIEVQYVQSWNESHRERNTFFPASWFSLHGKNIFDVNEWEILGYY